MSDMGAKIITTQQLTSTILSMSRTNGREGYSTNPKAQPPCVNIPGFSEFRRPLVFGRKSAGSAYHPIFLPLQYI